MLIVLLIISVSLMFFDAKVITAQSVGRASYGIGFLYGINPTFPNNIDTVSKEWSEHEYAVPLGLSLRLKSRRDNTTRIGLSVDAIISSFRREENDTWLLLAQMRPTFSVSQFANRDYRGFFVKLDLGVVLTYTESNTSVELPFGYYPSIGFEIGLAIPIAYRVSIDPFGKLALDYANDVLINPSTGVIINF